MIVSEALIVSAMATGVGILTLLLWYAKSILLTSRCQKVSCCCLSWVNDPLSDTELTQVLQLERPPVLQAPNQTTT